MQKIKLPLFVFEECTENDRDFLIDDGWNEKNVEFFIKERIRFSEFCGSSYDDHGSLEESEDVPEMMCMPFQEAIHDYKQVAANTPTLCDDVYIRQYLNPQKYTVILIAEYNNPLKLVGFASFSHTEYVNEGCYNLVLEFQCLYIFPNYQGLGIGSVVSRELARQIAEVRSEQVEIEKHKIEKGMVNVNVQCTSLAAQRCFSQFSNNFATMFDFDDWSGDIAFEFEDEY